MSKLWRGNILGLILGLFLGAAGARFLSDLPEETASFRGPGFQLLYQARVAPFSRETEYANQIHYRKLCGDAQVGCSRWNLVATRVSERPFPTKDINFAEAEGKVLLQFPDGSALKSDDQKTWQLEPPPR